MVNQKQSSFECPKIHICYIFHHYLGTPAILYWLDGIHALFWLINVCVPLFLRVIMIFSKKIVKKIGQIPTQIRMKSTFLALKRASNTSIQTQPSKIQKYTKFELLCPL